LVNPDIDTVKRTRNGLFSTPEREEPANADVSLATGSLETSNVNSVSALVNMIELSRQFETQVKMMKAAEENDVTAAQLLKLN
jgi:flagellar basal-body rod protein FlgF